jgi:hypothetical protein
LRNRDKTAHLAWCALVALQLARQDGLISSESQENLFITRWFALAKKQRRFSRDLAADIDWILNQGRALGMRAASGTSWTISGAAATVNCWSKMKCSG